MLELAEGLGFDLPDALAGDREVPADLLQRVVGLLADPEAHPQHLLLAGCQRCQHLPRLLDQIDGDDRIGRRDDALVLYEVAEVRVLFLAERRLQRDRLLCQLQDLPDLVERKLHLLGYFIGGGFASELVDQGAGGASDLVHRLDHVNRNADRAGQVRDRAGNGLADPPGCVGREFVAALVIEFVDGPHEADVAFLDQIQELQAAVGVLLPNRYHQTQVGLDQLGLGVLGHAFTGLDLAHDVAESAFRQLGLFLDGPYLGLRGGDGPRQRLELAGPQAQTRGDGLLFQRRRTNVAQRLAELLARQARSALAVDDFSMCSLDALDELLELEDDLIDLLLVESHLLQSVQDGLLEPAYLPSILLLGDLRNLGGQLLADFLLLSPEAAHLVDGLTDPIDVSLFVDLFLFVADVAHDILDANRLLAKLVAQVQDLFDRHRGVQHHLQDASLAILHTLGDLDLTLAGEQRNQPHLAQVQPHRIGGRRDPEPGRQASPADDSRQG